MSSGKQTGVIKFTLDNEKIITNDTINGSMETKIRFLESYLKPYIDLTALTMSNINMLNAYKNQALTDALTNLYNRRYITEYLYSLLNIAKRKESPLSVFMIDIDNFKRFNDEYGHKVGDTVLKIVSKTIKEAVREGDTVARYGGEEFIVVLPYSDTDAAYEVGERVRSAVEKIEWSESEVPNIPPVTISLGIAAYPLHGYSHYHLTNAADKALYKAKREGKNKVVVHDIKERQVGEAGLH
jgi:diguanylate cyclase (GGDEF)-like protein